MTRRFIQKETAASRPLAAAPTGDSPVSYPNFPAFPQPLPGGQNIISAQTHSRSWSTLGTLAGARGGMADMVCKAAGDDKRKRRPKAPSLSFADRKIRIE